MRTEVGLKYYADGMRSKMVSRIPMRIYNGKRLALLSPHSLRSLGCSTLGMNVNLWPQPESHGRNSSLSYAIHYSLSVLDDDPRLCHYCAIWAPCARTVKDSDSISILVAKFTRCIYFHPRISHSPHSICFPRYPLPMSQSAHQSFVPNNEQYVSSFDKGHLALPPAKRLIVGDYSPWIVPCLWLILGSSNVHGCSNRVRQTS